MNEKMKNRILGMILWTENALDAYMKARGEFSDVDKNIVIDQIELHSCQQNASPTNHAATDLLANFSGNSADYKKWLLASATKKEIGRIKDQIISGNLEDYQETIDMLMKVLFCFIDTMQKFEKTLPKQSFFKKYFSKPELGRIQNCLSFFGQLKFYLIFVRNT